MAGFEERRAAFSEQGVTLVAASVDSESDTRAVAGEVGFPVAYGVTRETADCIGAFWEPKRDHIQPSEFIMKADGRLMATLYSSAPVGRLDPADTLGLIQFLNQRSG